MPSSSRNSASISTCPAPQPGRVYLVGAGPGDPELLTLRACKLLRRANVVLHDDLVGPEVLALAGPEAKIVNVGKRCGAKKITQDEINRLMIDGARRELSVVRLKSGDPGIFGRLAEEIDALRAANIPFEVVPGITAGTAAAASLNVSLTDRRTASRVVIVTGHPSHPGEAPPSRDWQALVREDATLVIYMPGHNFAALRQELIDAGLPLDLPAVLVSHAASPQQRQQSTTLGDLDSLNRLGPPSILLMGRSLGRAAHRASEEPALDSAELDFILSAL